MIHRLLLKKYYSIKYRNTSCMGNGQDFFETPSVLFLVFKSPSNLSIVCTAFLIFFELIYLLETFNLFSMPSRWHLFFPSKIFTWFTKVELRMIFCKQMDLSTPSKKKFNCFEFFPWPSSILTNGLKIYKTSFYVFFISSCLLYETWNFSLLSFFC